MGSVCRWFQSSPWAYLGFFAFESASWESAAGRFSVFTAATEAIQLLQHKYGQPQANSDHYLNKLTINNTTMMDTNGCHVRTGSHLLSFPLVPCHIGKYSWQINKSQPGPCVRDFSFWTQVIINVFPPGNTTCLVTYATVGLLFRETVTNKVTLASSC